MVSLADFYRSSEWIAFRNVLINERINDEGQIICAYCGKPIVKAYDIIAHHCNTYLTEDNVNDATISLNPDNIQLVHHVCHNHIHNKLGYKDKKIYLVYGAPYAGKHTYVDSISDSSDLVISMDRIWECLGGRDGRKNAIAFAMRDRLIEGVKYRLGKWNVAYIIGGYPLVGERQRLCRELGAEEIFIDSTKGECLLSMVHDERVNPHEYKKYIEDWFEKYSPTPQSP